MIKINVNQIKIYNRDLIFEQIIRNKNMTRVEIARRTRLSNATVSTIVEEFAKQNIIVEKKDIRSSIGRKPSIIELTSYKKILCIDFATKNFVCKVKDLKLETLSDYYYTYDTELSFFENIQQFCINIKEQFSESIKNNEILGIGISVSGPYIQKEDTVITKLIPEIRSVKLKQILTEHFNLPVFIDHDVKLATMAEIQFIDPHKSKIAFYLFIGEGVGGTLSIQGRIYDGANEFAGEIGQINLLPDYTAEELLSFKIFKEKLIAHYGWTENTDINKAIIQKYDEQDPFIIQELDKIVLYLSSLLCNIIYMQNPHVIIIGGDYCIFGDQFLDRIFEIVKDRVFPEILKNVKLTFSQYERESSLIGAGKMVIKYWLDSNYFSDYN